MLLLGIETSCDETAAAVVEAATGGASPWHLRSSIVASQIDLHREWGGVVPEIASRQHVRDICGVVETALGEAAATWTSLDAVAVTQGPGLIGSLLVGVSFAKTAAWAAGKPLIAVNHLAGHIESLWLQNGDLPTPAVVLVVSGGQPIGNIRGAVNGRCAPRVAGAFPARSTAAHRYCSRSSLKVTNASNGR